MNSLKPRFEISALDAKADFREAIGNWFSRVGKDYPWRRTRDPYPVLVSEIMLQQTQIATVLGKGYYTRFLEKFPDLSSLAEADDESLLKAWEGLGYYRRARMLREAARKILEKHAGIFPNLEADILALPGIGPYTAAALMAFAFNKPSGLVDGNVSRIFSRMMDDPSPIDSNEVIRKQRKWAYDLCDPLDPSRHQHAIMELGQAVCRPGRPACEKCPVAKFCECREPEKLPVKKPPAKITNIEEHAIWARDDGGRILLHLETGKRRNGLWKLPLRLAQDCSSMECVYESIYPITRYRVALKIFSATEKQTISLVEGDVWVEPERLSELPIAAPFRKVLEALISDF